MNLLLLARTPYFFMGGIVLFLVLMSLYVYQINTLTQAAYQIAAHEKLLETLQDERNKLEAQYVQISSVQNLGQLAKERHFEKIGRVIYAKMSEKAAVRAPATKP